MITASDCLAMVSFVYCSSTKISQLTWQRHIDVEKYYTAHLLKTVSPRQDDIIKKLH